MAEFTVNHNDLKHFTQTAGLELAYPQDHVIFLVFRGMKILRHLDSEELKVEAYADPPGGDEHNDSFVMMWQDNQGKGHLKGVPCTSHPNWGYTRDPGGRPGAAFLPPYTVHRYVRGYHKGKPAYRAQGDINRVVRDVDKSGNITRSDIISKGHFGVNIHPGKVSAGCIVISGYWNSKNWKGVAYWRRPENDQKVFPLNIVPGIDIERWLQRDMLERDHWRPSITFGTINFWAHILQIKLWAIIQKPELIDGYWGPATQRAFDEFCDRKGIERTARLTPEIWRQMEV